MESRPSRVGIHYQVLGKIGEGSFGVIHRGKSDLTGKDVAIKFESKKSVAPQLRDEYRTYKLLVGTGAFNVLIMDLLGPSLEELFDRCGRRFSIKTVCQLAIQMINRVQSIHEKSLIYRDIKPDNFLIGHNNESSIIWAVDFGMAKHYRDPKTNQHIPYREKKSLSGTARYMSINTHLGREQSRRDDLEALGHVFLYFARGALPWQGLKANTNREKYEKIGERKQIIPIKELCEGFPPQFGQYLAYTRSLGFEETPDYGMLKNFFQSILNSDYDSLDKSYDWEYILQKQVNGNNSAHQGYESPTSIPNHLPITHKHQYGLSNTLDPTDRNIINPNSSHVPISTTPPACGSPMNRQPQVESARRIPLWRRFLCLCI